jgi:hemolysin D
VTLHSLTATIRAAISADRDRERRHVRYDDVEFLPAAVEVVETPVSPTGRATAWVLMGLAAATMVWITVGKVDVVASATGRIVPAGATKTVQSAGTGVISAIHVREGDHVRKGQVLVELDTTLADAELEQARNALLADELMVAGDRALVDAIDGKGVHFQPPDGTPPEVAEAQRKLIDAELREMNATVAGLEASRRASLADAGAAIATRNKMDGTMPMIDKEIQAMNRLDARGYAPGMRLNELQRQRRSDEGDRDVAVAQAQRGESDAGKFAAQAVQARETTRRTAIAEWTKAAADAAIKRDEVTKAMRRQVLEKIVAPTDGTVQQLAVHTVGGVVEPARPLMAIVPARDAMEVEAHVLNKDVGFVHEGQLVAIKVEAFPFSRFGTVPGRVISISHDSIPDNRLGPTYLARIELQRTTIADGTGASPLSPGMAVTADIQTGRRRIISWLISPLVETVSQAGHEQ